jgi:hypothetical protein
LAAERERPPPHGEDSDIRVAHHATEVASVRKVRPDWSLCPDICSERPRNTLDCKIVT